MSKMSRDGTILEGSMFVGTVSSLNVPEDRREAISERNAESYSDGFGDLFICLTDVGM